MTALNWFTAGCCVMLLFVGCTDISPLGDSNAVTADEQVITESGGELNVKGARLIVPEGVLVGESVRLSRVELPQPLPSYARAVSDVYMLAPPGVADSDGRFGLSVTLSEPGEGEYMVMMTNEGCGQWLLAESIVGEQVLQGNVLVTTLAKFGVFVVVEVDEAFHEVFTEQVLSETGETVCLTDEDCLVEECNMEEEEGEDGEVECELSPESGVCGVTGVCLPALSCACLQSEQCNLTSFGCRTSSGLSDACAVGFDVLVGQDEPYDPFENPSFE